MLSCKVCLNLSTIFMLVFYATAQSDLEKQNATLEHVCRLLNENFVISSPWTVYPIIYEPINRGRLTIWTGVSTLPTSEFKCYGIRGQSKMAGNETNEKIIMDFASFANELGWTFYDMNKGVTYHGLSVSHNKNVKYLISMSNEQMDSYSECNAIKKIEQLALDNTTPSVQTACQDCTQYLLSLINGHITELIKSKLNEQIMDNLYWQLTQLLSNQHFSAPISLLDSNSNRK